jgi:hypothetical protein
MICERESDFGNYLLFLWLYCYVSLILVEGIMDTGMGPDTEESRIRGMIVRQERIQNIIQFPIIGCILQNELPMLRSPTCP